jgi:hypothetical protein
LFWAPEWAPFTGQKLVKIVSLENLSLQKSPEKKTLLNDREKLTLKNW